MTLINHKPLTCPLMWISSPYSSHTPRYDVQFLLGATFFVFFTSFLLHLFTSSLFPYHEPTTADEEKHKVSRHQTIELTTEEPPTEDTTEETRRNHGGTT